MIDVRKVAIPGLIVLGAAMLTGCGDPAPAASPTVTESAMMEGDEMMSEDATSDDEMMSEDATSDDEMMSEDATSDDEMMSEEPADG